MAALVDERWLPARLTASPTTDPDFADFVAEDPDLAFKTTAEGERIVMPPNRTKAGARNNEAAYQLGLWARLTDVVVFDSSAGLLLPNGAPRSPDVSWPAKNRIAGLDAFQKKNYFRLCPDFVIEIRSQTDRLSILRQKMREYVENGAELGWLIDPDCRSGVGEPWADAE